jgi:periplasmic nitrate reductase NapD
MRAELHITSVIVHARPEALATVCAEIGRLQGVEVHAVGPTGKIVVTLETADEREAMDRMDSIRAIAGTIDTAMVYHAIDITDPNSEDASP